MKRLRLKKGLVCFGTQTSMNPKRGKADFIVPAPAVVALRIQPVKKNIPIQMKTNPIKKTS